MNKIFLFAFLILFHQASYSQSKSIIGAWLWKDSLNTISLFINKDSTISKRIGSEKIKTGKYVFKNNVALITTWDDNTTEHDKIKVIDKSTIEVWFNIDQTKTPKKLLFYRVVDEEFVPDK